MTPSDRRARRVVVTGIGAVTAAGIGVEPYWQSALEGRSHLAPANGTMAARFGPLSIGRAPLPPEAEGERAGAAAILAAREAIAGAGLEAATPPGPRVRPRPSGVATDALPADAGVVLGTCLGGMQPALGWIDEVTQADATGEAAPPFPSEAGLAAPARRVARACGLLGPILTVSTACSSGAAAIAEACNWIRDGGADLMLAGGAESLTPFVLSGFAILQTLTPGLMRPFDRRRDGLALGEGAAIVVLEEREAARRRRAPILAEILGAGATADAHHMTAPAPEGEGLGRAIEAALAEARLDASSIGFVNAHGTGTVHNDRAEAAALRRLFRRNGGAPVDAVKPVTGHTLGASGGLETILCIRAIRSGLVPPTIGCEQPETDLDIVRGGPRRGGMTTALSLSCGFGGHNVALVVAAP
ncbi:MAG TPA: beta-ketoacyl-[acyl-carrier-protein] synthase family protein [Candidatus Polarisedimenticolia bacterium]|nr:beta-ketoacyl-[acyl-carrier-protein] synthase family protein [Candidatus Polarisedimenticolia bacterium]